MEWRRQSVLSCEAAYSEAQRWIEAVTKQNFGSSNFRSSLENGVLLCDLINKINPGIIKKFNRPSTPIAGLDNLNLFLKACAKLGLKEAQLFHPGDLQDLSTRVTVKHQESSRRLKNVLITIYWLGRKAYADPFYNGPYLKLKEFEGLLGTALYKALEDSSSLRGSVREGSYTDGWYSEKEELYSLRAGHRREDSLDSLDSLGSRTNSTSSDTTLKGSEGCGSDPEVDLAYMMTDNKEYRRSLVITPKTTTQFNQFLPSKDKQTGYVPAPLRKKRAEQNEDNRRSWGGPLYTEADGSFTRSKSVNDITDDQAELISVSKEVRYDELKKMREKLKENEDKWQDDLTRWKNKRKSVNSDIVKKKEEREHIELLTSGSSRKSKTFKEMQDGREGREQGSFRNSLNSFVDDVFEEPTPRSRTLPARSYTIDTPYAPVDKPSVSSVPSVWEDEPTAGTLASDQTDYPAKRERSIPDIQRNMKNQSSTSLIKPTSTITPTSPSKPTNTSTVFNSSQQLPSFSNAKPVESSSGPISSLYKPISMETKQPGLDRVSASLPRSYQKSDSTRLTSVVTPRPFGTQANRVTSLPRTFTTDNSHKRMNGETDKKPTVPSRYAAYMTEEETLSQDSPLHSSDEEEEEEEEERVSSGPQTPSPVPPVNRVPPLRKAASPVSSPNENTQAEYSEMRISLNQKPNSSQGFGFQTDWDSTGARVKSVVAGSPAELSQVKVGDEILTVNGHRVAEMSYKEWKNSLEEALQEGSLFMDIRRHGQNSSPEPHLSTNLNLTSHQAKDTIVKTVNVSSQSGNNIGSNGINGGFRDELGNPNKESESISSKNLKRRSEFFEQGGSETAISNLPMPTVSAPSNRWSWDPEEERRRQEKWQKEQERMLQEKYKKDQEKLDEEWRKAQQEFAKDSSKNHKEIISLEQDRYSPYSPLSSNRQSTPTWEEQEVSRLAQQLEEQKKREQERQRLEEERRKRQEKERLEEERKKREEEEGFRQENERRKQEEERKRLEEQRRLQEQDNVDSYGYTNVYPELSYSHRAISKSTPELDEFAKPDIKGVYNQHRGMAGWLLEQELRRKKNAQIQRQIAASQLEFERRNILNAMKYREPERASGGLGEVGRDNKKEPLSQAELERQQIIQEMKKKTNLNRDSSWIRQQPPSTTTTRDPIDLPIRRGESLDNLDMPRTSWRSSWSTSGSTSSIPDYNRPQSALSSSSTSYRAGRPGSATMQASQSMSSLRQSWSPSPPASTTSPEPEPQAPPKNRSVSGRKICSLCKSPLGKGAAMIIESLGLCYHLGCFKCIDCRADLGGSEAGAEVRIRNQQLYCNACYTRLKGGQPTSM